MIPLFRDEVLYIHNYIQVFFESIKGYGKKVTEIKDCYNNALQNACNMHRERRKFLRSALRELVLLCSDQPGLLGPKALFVFMGLCFARDEVCHSFNYFFKLLFYRKILCCFTIYIFFPDSMVNASP